VKDGVWCAVSARRNVVPVFFIETIAKISVYREDGIFK
jgi:hypothetical protein